MVLSFWTALRLFTKFIFVYTVTADVRRPHVMCGNNNVNDETVEAQ